MQTTIKSITAKYLAIPKVVIYLLWADVFLQLINAAFTLSLNYLLLENGYKDYEITSLIGNRYLTVLLASVPLAILLKGRNTKPFLVAGSLFAPIIALLLIVAIAHHQTQLIRLLMSAWGIAFSFLQILSLPFIIHYCDEDELTPAIASFFLIGNVTTIVAGGLNYFLPMLSPFFNTQNILIIISVIGLAGLYFILKTPNQKIENSPKATFNLSLDYDWGIILKAIIPTFLIAFGAGFTIPFINLFFKSVHDMDAHHFSLMNMVAFTFVTIVVFLAPAIKDKLGLKIGIILFQSLGIVVLFLLGTTEWFVGYEWCLGFAVFLFIIRQPLMTLAAPMTSEVTMGYVGERNREITSAIISAIWSGSWYVSAILFSIFREMKIAYSNIIFITVGFYILGVLWYYRLIVAYEKKQH